MGTVATNTVKRVKLPVIAFFNFDPFAVTVLRSRTFQEFSSCFVFVSLFTVFILF